MTNQDTYHPDNDLFRSFCGSEKFAMEKIYNDFFPSIRGMVWKNHGGVEDARDLFQEGLLVLLNYCNRNDFALNVPLKHFLYAVCRKLWLKKLEKKGRLGITFTDTLEYIDISSLLKIEEERAKTAQQLRVLWKHFRRLPQHEQKVLMLYYFEGKSHAEIAEEMGFSSEASARVQKFKYIRHLRGLVLNDPDAY